MKEKHDNLFASNNGSNRVDNPGFFEINDMVKVTEIPDRFESKTIPEDCKKGGKCTPAYVTNVKIDGYKIITYNVHLRTKIDVYDIDASMDEYNDHPSKTDFAVLLKIYNDYNTNGGKIIEVAPGDEQNFAN